MDNRNFILVVLLLFLSLISTVFLIFRLQVNLKFELVIFVIIVILAGMLMIMHSHGNVGRFARLLFLIILLNCALLYIYARPAGYLLILAVATAVVGFLISGPGHDSRVPVEEPPPVPPVEVYQVKKKRTSSGAKKGRGRKKP